MQTAIQELMEWMEKNEFMVNKGFIEKLNECLEKEKEQIINFHNWMLKNDNAENADKYFHYSHDDMFNEYLKTNNL
jgi:hypothetical protein